METLYQDVRFALRTLWTNRGFAFVAIVALALGVGANSAIFSVVNSVVLRPLPYKDPERLVALWVGLNQKGFDELEVSAPEFTDFRTRSSSFEHVVVISHSLWQRRFGGDSEVVGKSLTLDGKVCTVVGVMPASFHFPDNDT